MSWIKVCELLPPEGEEVLTKIDDWEGERNIQNLVRKGNFWFHPDMSMYVYYTPTHWKSIAQPIAIAEYCNAYEVAYRFAV